MWVLESERKEERIMNYIQPLLISLILQSVNFICQESKCLILFTLNIWSTKYSLEFASPSSYLSEQDSSGSIWLTPGQHLCSVWPPQSCPCLSRPLSGPHSLLTSLIKQEQYVISLATIHLLWINFSVNLKRMSLLPCMLRGVKSGTF